MDVLDLLAQAQPTTPWWSGETEILGRSVPLVAWLAIPLFLALLALVTYAVEFLLNRGVRAITTRTRSEMDDALVLEISRLVRPAVVLVAVHVIVLALVGPEHRATAMRAALVLSIAVAGFAMARFFVNLTDAWVGTDPKLTPLGSPIKLGIKIAVVPVVVVCALQVLEVPVTSFVAALGLGSLAVALALKDTLANMFAGIQLVLDQPIRAGDFVEVDQKVRGVVHEIGLRSTKIRTLENNMIIVPNNTLAQTIVINNDAFDRAYSHRFFVGVSYSSDTRHVQRVLQDVLDTCGREVEGVLPGPHAVRFVEFGDSALVFRLEVRLEQYPGRRGPLSEMHHRIHERLREEGVEIPFPMRTVVIRHEGPSAAEE